MKKKSKKIKNKQKGSSKVSYSNDSNVISKLRQQISNLEQQNHILDAQLKYCNEQNHQLDRQLKNCYADLGMSTLSTAGLEEQLFRVIREIKKLPAGIDILKKLKNSLL